MRGGWRAVATASLVLFLGACSFGNCSPVAKTPQTTPSSQASATSSSTTSPAETPASPPQTSPSPSASPSPAKLIIKSFSYHVGEVGITYAAVTLVAAGGVKPYKWSLEGGALPP